MSYTPGIVNNPGAVLENTIKPAVDTATALQIQQHSGTQSAPLLSFYDAAGTTFLGGVGPNASAVWKGLGLNVTPKSTNYTTLGTDYYIPVDATAGAVTITLKPSTGTPFGSQQRISKVDASANAVTVQRGGADTINGGTSIVLANQYDTAVLQSDGAGAWNAVLPASLTPAVILAPDTANRNLIQPTADGNKGLVVKSHSSGQSAHLIEAQHTDGTSCFFVDQNACVTAVDATQADLDAFNNDWGYNQDNLSAFGPGGAFVDLIGFTNGPNPCVSNLQFFAVNRSAPNGSRVANPFTIQAGATVANAGTVSNRTWKLVSGANTLIDCGSNTIGFLGAAAVVQQALPAAATDPATTQTLANSLRSLAIAFGLGV